jgi:hypothetical protein
MGPLGQIISAISAVVVANLAAAGYPALTDGGIVIGTAAEFEQGDAPRIIFDPSPGSKFQAPEWYSASAMIHTAERERQIATRTIAGDNVSFSVHCWGAGLDGTIVDDYDVTRALYHAVRAAVHAVAPGAYQIEDSGKYRTGTNIVRRGRWFTFNLTLYTPILTQLTPYIRDPSTYVSPTAYAPDDSIPQGTLTMLDDTETPS